MAATPAFLFHARAPPSATRWLPKGHRFNLLKKEYDENKAAAFADKLLTTLNHGSLSLAGRAGFKSIETNELAHDIQNYWYVIRK